MNVKKLETNINGVGRIQPNPKRQQQLKLKK